MGLTNSVILLLICSIVIETNSQTGEDSNYDDDENKFFSETILPQNSLPTVLQNWIPIDIPQELDPNFDEGSSTTPLPDVLLSTDALKSPVHSPIGYDKPCGIRGKGRTSPKITGTDRVVGGYDASRGEFPWAVSIQVNTGPGWRHTCGGSIISRNWVVTAGHCVDHVPVTSLSVVAGDYNLYKKEGTEQRVNVVRSLGRNFVKYNFTEDIALLQVKPPFDMSSSLVAPLCLPPPNRKYLQGNGIVAGWGRLKERGTLPSIIQTASIPIIPMSKCRQLYSSSGFSDFLHPCQICSGWEKGGIDTCQGDSGGGMMCEHSDGRYYLCGIVSWGVGCARPRYPGVYTDVSCYSQWIADILYDRSDAIKTAIDLQKVK